jgi:hypothetical protein
MGSGADRYLGGRTRAISLAAVAGLLAWVALFVWLGASQEESGAGPAPLAPREVAASAADRGDAGGPSPDVVTLAYGYDIRDERLVVGLSDNVFAGRVERVAARRPARTTIPGEGRPQTRYAVRVLTVVTAGFSGHDPHRMMHVYGLHRDPADWPKDASERKRVSIDATCCSSRLSEHYWSAHAPSLRGTTNGSRRADSNT